MRMSRSATTYWSESSWYIFSIIVICAVVSISAYALIQLQKQFLLDQKHKELATIADLKTSQLVEWRKERIAEGASIRANGMMAHRINDYCSAGSDKAGIRQEFRRWMANLIELGEYSKGALLNAAGEVITSDPKSQQPLSRHYLDLVSETVSKQEIILSNFHSDINSGRYEINLSIPIMDLSGARPRCVAVLVLEIDPDKRLYPLIQSWPTSSTTAETLLVMREADSVLFLNELRHRKRTTTQFQLPLTQQDIPAVRAVLGQQGSFEGVDYRNVPVLSEIRTVPGTQWGLVAKVDTSEIVAPLSKSIRYIASAAAIIMIAMILGVFLWGLQRKLRREIVERERLEKRLLSAKRLESIGQIASGVAHEVRNPLNAILTITEALFREQEIASNPEFEPFIQHIRSQVTRLASLMNDLLDLGRTIPTANLQPLPLYQLCRETADLWKSTGLSPNKRVLLTSDSDDISLQVLADPLKLQQVFFNLLENAGHHSCDGGKIMLRLMDSPPGRSDGLAVVQVIDQGCGIAADKLPHVFDPFYTDRTGGTGLGLALVRHFLENMGGSVQIRNNDPPPGCTVEVHIPLYRKEL